MTSSSPRYRARSKREKFIRDNRLKILAALCGLAAAIGLLLAGPPLFTQKTMSPLPVRQAENIQVTPATPQPVPPAPQLSPTAQVVPPLTTPSAPSRTATAQPGLLPNWVLNASSLPRVSGPQLALVIDDMGEDIVQSKQALKELPPEVTLAFLPYPQATPALARQARHQGHELLIHLPMQPKSDIKQMLTPKESTLLVTDTPAELEAKITQNLNDLKDIVVGVNNHMGSAFTQNLPGMQILLKELDNQKLMFLDSLTIAPTATRQAAQNLTLPLLTRNVFLDDIIEETQIQQELDRAITHAKTHGSAIAIGHPHAATLAVLSRNLNKIKDEGVTLVPLTHLLPATN